jgi:hypothetical protein
MTTMPPQDVLRPGAPQGTRGKPAAGRPALFATMLVLAAAGVLALLVVGPALPIPLAVHMAAGLMGVVALAWIVAGPRL